MKTDTLFRTPGQLASDETLTRAPEMEDLLPADMYMEEMEIRAGMCQALSHMSASMRALLGLMARHNCITVLPDAHIPAYEQIMERMAESVAQATVMVERSRELDRRTALACLPRVGTPRQ